MKKLILAASVLALGMAGTGVGHAQTAGPAGSGSVQTEQGPRSEQTSQDQIRQAQQKLTSAGLYNGPLDGEMNAETRQAVSQFQQQRGLPQSGTLDRQTLAALDMTTDGAGSSTTPPAASGPSAPMEK
jgi:peptidoglycan hydrolase-like protein with peptidoglycan-binding domain